MDKKIKTFSYFSLPKRLTELEEKVEELDQGSGTSVTWDSIELKPLVIASGATQAAARTAIGAGTGNSNLAVGTTAGTALGTANAGSSAQAARADHVHPLPAVATTTANGLLSSADKTKLDGLVSANLLNRANHTGTQAISTITGVVPIAQVPTGTTATTVALGNHNHAITADAASGLSAAANLQALAVALSARIKALEDAAV